jgi:hypothetical protein
VVQRRAVAALALVGAFAISGPAGAVGGGGDVDASAEFTVRLGSARDRFDFVQNPVTASTLEGTRQVPVSLHASDPSDPFEELVLAGRPAKGKQRTSDALALGLNIGVGGKSMLFSSTDGECTIRVRELSATRIAGRFTCDATYGGDPLGAKGTFKAG